MNRLEYLDGAMTVYGTYSSNSINDIADAISKLHKNILHHEKIITGKIPHWYSKNFHECRIHHLVLTSLLYLQDLKMNI